MSVVAIIIARGGSKRIPRKNIKDFLGRPIIAYPIEVALKSGLFDEVMVSTDDQEIADIAKSFGAAVPFLRSTKNANDHATTADVIKEVLEEYQKNGQNFEYLCCIYPTAVSVTPERLIEAMKKLKNHEVSAVFPVTKFSYPIQRALKIDVDGLLSMVSPENVEIRSQDFSPAYHDAGQFYCLRTASFLDNPRIDFNGATAFILPESEVQDIDTMEDWKIAEMKFKLIFN